jgi:sugar O-acyltransferase (sialic acid O-acetyltransferase NeuD family)
MQPLIIVGTGGMGRETLDAVRDCNDVRPTWEVVGFVDDDPRLRGQQVGDVPVIGNCEQVRKFPQAKLVVTIGNPSNFTVRRRIVRQLDLSPDRYATIVHPHSSISRSSSVGPGSVILAGVVATNAVVVGAHVVVMPAVVLTHDDVVGDYATLTTGVHLAGGVSIGEGAYLGAGCQVREGRRIGPWSLIGMGAGVLCDVPPGQVWAGLPARYMRPVATLPPDMEPLQQPSQMEVAE